jgi:hypothetical protein
LCAILCVAALTAVLTGATTPLANTQFALAGHWVFNSVLQTVFHIDGATTNIDAHLPVSASPGSQVVQDESNGYVVGPNSITEFDKSTLSVRQAIAAPADEVPLGIEAVGGPYLVYRNAGKVVRLGDPPATISVGGAIGDPLVTSDGTMWLHRNGNGSICSLPKGADQLAGCPVAAQKDHPGALTMIGGRLEFVDLFTAQLHTVGPNSLGPGIPLGFPVSPDSRVAAQDLAGRAVLLDPERHSLLLIDAGNRSVKPVTIALPGGDYDGPVSTGSTAVVIDRQSGTVLTFGPDGSRKDTTPIGPENGQPRITHGEDNRVYVDNANGTQVFVIGEDGKVQDVPVTGKPAVPQTSVPPTGQQADAKPTGPTTPSGQDGHSDQAGQGGSRRTAAPPPRQPPAVPPSAPGAPSGVSASAGDSAVTVNWSAAQDNRSPITTYRVMWRADSGETGSVTVGGNSRHSTVNGLTNGVGYVFTVSATNAVGTGPGVATSSVVPYAVASAPTPTASHISGGASVSWTQPDLHGGTLADYVVSATGQSERTVTSTSTSYTGLTPGQTYTFTVRAVTTAGGQTLTGAGGTTSLTLPAESITISEGQPTTSGNCAAPNCADVDATMTGLAPNTTYSITLSSTDDSNVQTEQFTTDASGSGTHNDMDYDQPGVTIWMSVPTSDGKITSNKIVWEKP